MIKRTWPYLAMGLQDLMYGPLAPPVEDRSTDAYREALKSNSEKKMEAAEEKRRRKTERRKKLNG